MVKLSKELTSSLEKSTLGCLLLDARWGTGTLGTWVLLNIGTYVVVQRFVCSRYLVVFIVA